MLGKQGYVRNSLQVLVGTVEQRGSRAETPTLFPNRKGEAQRRHFSGPGSFSPPSQKLRFSLGSREAKPGHTYATLGLLPDQ